MEQQKHYPREYQEEEEHYEALQLQGRQFRHRNNGIVPVVFSNYEELYKAAAGFAEEDRDGVSSQNDKILEEDKSISAIQVASREEVSYQNVKILEDNVDADLIEKIGEELTDFGVEEVIKKQDTHDLFCPNCRSCITRRVILVRRKKSKFVLAIGGRNKNPNMQIPICPIDDSTGELPIENFRCLSCFSIFIPRDANRKEEAAGNECAVAKACWPWSIFIPITNKKTGGDVILQVEPDDKRITGVERWDILKSIVYGGLMESITSLGVVSSAAGAGATTLNIFAMGLANLIAGLFVLGHNLRELKNERYEQEGRYQNLLGRKGNFPLHASLAVISFLFFGLLPPVIYGFSFRESDNEDLKLAVVLGASLICITLLVIAKCHVNKSPPKSYIKTILYYISTGIAASCVSYLAAELIDKLMEKLGWFDSNSTSNSTVAVSSLEASKLLESA